MDVLQVCISCRFDAEQRFLEGKPGGRVLYDKLKQLTASQDMFELRPVECMSACRSYCVASLVGAKKTTLVFGHLDVARELEETSQTLVKFAGSYAASPDGFFKRAERPLLLQSRLLVRVPPPEGLARPDWPLSSSDLI